MVTGIFRSISIICKTNYQISFVEIKIQHILQNKNLDEDNLYPALSIANWNEIEIVIVNGCIQDTCMQDTFARATHSA